MRASSPWNDWYHEYENRWTAKMQPILERFPDRTDVIRTHLKPSLVPLPVAVERFKAASDQDLQWLVGALGNERRKWFVADTAAAAKFLPEGLFEPMLRAAVEEVHPSFNRRFVEPCTRMFGPRRVQEYLLAVLESGDDFHKTGAVGALYWAEVGVSYRLTHPIPSPLILRPEDADQESLAAYNAISDLRDRRRRLFLETFVANPNLDLRRVLIASLDLDETAYPDTHKHLVAAAIRIAREHPDEYIRHRVQVQLGETNVMQPLPARSSNQGSE